MAEEAAGRFLRRECSVRLISTLGFSPPNLGARAFCLPTDRKGLALFAMTGTNNRLKAYATRGWTAGTLPVVSLAGRITVGLKADRTRGGEAGILPEMEKRSRADIVALKPDGVSAALI